MILRPDLLRQHRQLDELGVLESIADDGGVVVGQRRHGHQLGLRSRFQPELERFSEIENFLDDLALLVHLDGIHAHVIAGVFVLGDGGLKRLVDVLQAMPQDVPKPHERRQADAPELQVIDQLLQVDRALRLLRRVNLDVTVLAYRKVPLPPAGNLIHFGGVDRRPRITDVVSRSPGHRLIHVASHDTRLCCCKMPALMNSGASFLSRLPLFAEISSEMLARLEHRMRRRDFAPRAVIVREGSREVTSVVSGDI